MVGVGGGSGDGRGEQRRREPSYLITATVAADERDLSPRCRRCRGPPTTLPAADEPLSYRRPVPLARAHAGATARLISPVRAIRGGRLTDLYVAKIRRGGSRSSRLRDGERVNRVDA